MSRPLTVRVKESQVETDAQKHRSAPVAESGARACDDRMFERLCDSFHCHGAHRRHAQQALGQMLVDECVAMRNLPPIQETFDAVLNADQVLDLSVCGSLGIQSQRSGTLHVPYTSPRPAQARPAAHPPALTCASLPSVLLHPPTRPLPASPRPPARCLPASLLPNAAAAHTCLALLSAVVELEVIGGFQHVVLDFLEGFGKFACSCEERTDLLLQLVLQLQVVRVQRTKSGRGRCGGAYV